VFANEAFSHATVLAATRDVSSGVLTGQRPTAISGR
jgi:hypothetical protein